MRFGKEELIANLENISAHLNDMQIAEYLGISLADFNDLLNNDDDLRHVVETERKAVIIDISKSLVEKARKGHTQSQIFYLENKAGWLREAEKISVRDNNLIISFGDKDE